MAVHINKIDSMNICHDAFLTKMQQNHSSTFLHSCLRHFGLCVCQEYSELLEQPAETGRTRDALLDKLKSRIRDRDKALEVLHLHCTIIIHLSLH